MAAALYYARRELRRQARSVALLALVVAVVVAGVLACATAARRSGSALDRLDAYSHASDTTLEIDDLDLADRIAALDVVEQATAMIPQLMSATAAGGEYFPLLADRDGIWLRSMDRVRVVDGALPRLDDPDAVVMTEAAAEGLEVGVGDPLPVVALSAAEANRLETEELAPPFHGPRITLRVAAIVRLPPTNNDPQALTLSVLTPAFLERHGQDVPSFGALVVLRLRPGATFADLAKAVGQLPGGEGVVRDEVGTGGEDAARAALDTVAFGLAALAVAAALAGLVIAGQGVTRLVLWSADDAPVLAALGVGTRARVVAACATAAVSITVGVAIGVAVAPLIAPLLEGGLARRTEPDPGPVLDLPVLALGAALAVLLLLVIAGASVSLLQRGGDSGRSGRRGTLAATAGSAGLPVATVAGLAVTFSRSGRRVPTRQALVGALASVIGVSGAVVFGASLDRALDDPHQYGWAWEASVTNGMEDRPGELDRRGVTDAAVVTYAIATHLDGEPITAISVRPVRGAIQPVVVRGRLPSGVDDVLVGEKTLDDLQLAIGDHAELRGPRGHTDVRIVGTTAIPGPDAPLPMARGAVIDPAVVDELGLTEMGYRQLAVRVEGDPHRAFSDLGEGDEVLFPSPPVEVGRLDEVRSFPAVLAGFLALVAALAVGHALSLTVRRRRRDLGVLRAVGFTGGQVREAVLAQGMVIVGAALVVGLPLGVVAGRLGWRAVTESIGLPFVAVVPVAWLAAVVVAVGVVAAVAALPSVATSGRLRPGAALAAE